MFDMLKKPRARNMQAFVAELRKAKLRFTIDKKKYNVDIAFSGDHFKNVTFSFYFNEDGKSVTVFALGVVELPSEPFDKVCRFCNELNLDSCWLRYDADEKDNSIDAELEIAVGKKDAGEICLFVLQEIVGELDDTLGKFRK